MHPHNFLMPQKGSEALIKPFLGTTKKRRNKNLCYFLFHLIVLGCLEQEGLINFFSWDSQKYIKNGNKYETCFNNVPFRHCTFRNVSFQHVLFKIG